MPTTTRPDSGRLTIAEAKRCIRETSPREMFVDVFQSPDGSLKVVKNEESLSIFAAHLDQDFATTCEQLGIVPRFKYRPAQTGYTGNPETDALYTIDHAEFMRLAALFDLPGSPQRPVGRPVQAQTAQEVAILEKISELKYVATALPKNSSGLAGVKATVSAAIGKCALFHSKAVFDKAWQRLRDDGRIADA